MGGGQAKARVNPESLQRSPIFAEIGLAECERLLCPLFARKRLAAGASLYANPTVAKRNDLIIVESGSLLLRVMSKGGEAIELHRYVIGDVLGVTENIEGTMGLDHVGTSPIEIIALEKATLLALSRETYTSVVEESLEPAFAALRANLRCMTTTACVKWLRKISFFDSLRDGELEFLALIGSFTTYHSGVALLKEGTIAQAFFILLHGSLEVSMATSNIDAFANAALEDAPPAASPPASPKGTGVEDLNSSASSASSSSSSRSRRKSLGTLQPGSLFGESALLGHSLKVSASVATCSERNLVLRFDGGAFRNFLKLQPHCREGVEKIMKMRNMARLKALTLPIFDGLSPNKLAVVLQTMETKTYAADERVFSRGDQGDYFYLLLQGAITIANDEDVVISTLTKQGDYFGEMALITDQPRNASAIATCATTCGRLPITNFREVFLYSVIASAEFELKALGQKTSATAVMSHPFTSQIFAEFLEKEQAQESYLFWEAVREYRSDYQLVTLNARAAAMALAEACAPAEDVAKALEDGLALCVAKATAVFKTYVDHATATLQVNLSSKTTKKVKDKLDCCKATDGLDDTPVTRDLFDDAQAEITKLLQRSNMGRFVKTDEFDKALAEIGGYHYQEKDPRFQKQNYQLPSHQEIERRKSVIKTQQQERKSFRDNFRGSLLG